MSESLEFDCEGSEVVRRAVVVPQVFAGLMVRRNCSTVF